jgi:hypothetical protein
MLFTLLVLDTTALFGALALGGSDTCRLQNNLEKKRMFSWKNIFAEPG